MSVLVENDRQVGMTSLMIFPRDFMGKALYLTYFLFLLVGKHSQDIINNISKRLSEKGASSNLLFRSYGRKR